MNEENRLDWPPRTAEMEKAFREIYSSGEWWKYTGERVRKLEQEFPLLHDCTFGISVCNGSVAIDIALKAMNIRPGDEVILPAYDFFSLPKSVLNLGASPIFVDVNPRNFTIDQDQVKKKISSKTKAVVAVHISGSVAEMDALRQIALENEIFLLEDCAQAHGAVYDGKKVGSWGHLAVFSFGGIKLMTCGQGGMIVTSDVKLYHKCYAIVNRGHLPDGKVNPYGIIGENYQMSELQAAILLPQIGLLENYARKREQACLLLDEELSRIDGIETLPQFPKTSRRAHMRYSFRYTEKLSGRLSRENLIGKLKTEGIPAIAGYSSAAADPRLQDAFVHQKDQFPNSIKAQEQLIGVHHTYLLNQQANLLILVDLIKNLHGR
jgi:dTDP-4-amino-4,6-dideoxygalactose transaminase